MNRFNLIQPNSCTKDTRSWPAFLTRFRREAREEAVDTGSARHRTELIYRRAGKTLHSFNPFGTPAVKAASFTFPPSSIVT